MDEKSFNRWKREFQEKLKQENMSIRIYKNNKKIILKDFRGRLLSEFGRVGEKGLQRGYMEWNGLSERLVQKTMEYWEGFAKANGCSYIIFDDVSDMDPAFKILKELGYQKTEDYEEKVNVLAAFGNLYRTHLLKEIKSDVVKEYITLRKTLDNFFDDMRKHYPTFNAHYLTTMENFKRIQFYFQGYKGNIEIKENEKDYTFIEESGFAESFKTEKELQILLEKLFQKIKKRQKTKNLFEPPKKYFTQYMQTMKINNTIQQNSAYLLLRGNYDPETIEEFCYSNLKGKEQNEYGIQQFNVRMCKMFGKLFVLAPGVSKLFETEEIEKAKNHYKELVLNEMQKSYEQEKKVLEETIDDFI